MNGHFALDYAKYVNESLHVGLRSTWNFKHEIYEVSGLVTALLITYDNQRDDEFCVQGKVSWKEFLRRMSRIKPDWAHFSRENGEGFAKRPDKTILGWEGRTIYFIKGGSHPEFWTIEKAREDMVAFGAGILSTPRGELVQAELESAAKLIPVGSEHSRAYENLLRRVVNYVFAGYLGECKAQDRTEPGNEGTEIRDLLCQNRADAGIWRDLKDKYQSSEVLFEAKNKKEVNRDDLRQVYCYLKPALGLWGFVVCRTAQSDKLHAYNRTLFKNFAQSRGVLILADEDLKRMVQMKMRDRDPSDYIRDKYSEFIRSV